MPVSAMTLSNAWRSRPPEDCFWTLGDMAAATEREMMNSVERDYAPATLTPFASEESDSLGILPIGGHPLTVSFHAFAQLSSLAFAPAGYLRTLPVTLAADCLAVGLARRESDRDVAMLANIERAEVRAFTGPAYSRLWSFRLISMVQDAMARSGRRYVTPPAWVSPGWNGPTRTATAEDVGPWTRVRAGETIRPAGLYYSPGTGRDTFAFFINTEREIELPGKSSGFRFLMFWNSESGAASVGAAQGVVDIVCGNHILWGMRDVREFRFRHVGAGLSARSERELLTVFRALDATPWETNILQSAATHILGDTQEAVLATAVRATRLPASVIEQARLSVSSRDYGHPASAYAVASALTEYSQRARVEDRVDIDRAAARLYSIAA